MSVHVQVKNRNGTILVNTVYETMSGAKPIIDFYIALGQEVKVDGKLVEQEKNDPKPPPNPEDSNRDE